MAIKKLRSNYKATIQDRLEKIITSYNSLGESFKVEATVNAFNEQLIALPTFLSEEYIQAQVEPVLLNTPYDKGKWLYQDEVYEADGVHINQEKKLLILEFADKERQKFERLAAKFSKEQTDHVKHERTRIPENVRIEVWRRDEGKCAGCGSRVNLEYDHYNGPIN